MLGSISIENILIVIVVLLISMTIHEAMHAYVGLKLGDDTAAEEGRVSLNPLKHIDPLMTIVLPAVAFITIHALILAAKPVPFSPDRVKYGDFGAAMIALAGPLSNLALAVLGVIIARTVGLDVLVTNDLFGNFMYTFILFNVGLFVFNLVPIPPLDGSRVLYAFAPEPLQDFMRRIEPYGFFIILALVFMTSFGHFIAMANQAVLNFLL